MRISLLHSKVPRRRDLQRLTLDYVAANMVQAYAARFGLITKRVRKPILSAISTKESSEKRSSRPRIRSDILSPRHRPQNLTRHSGHPIPAPLSSTRFPGDSPDQMELIDIQSLNEDEMSRLVVIALEEFGRSSAGRASTR
jgi:hypothetical protein